MRELKRGDLVIATGISHRGMGAGTVAMLTPCKTIALLEFSNGYRASIRAEELAKLRSAVIDAAFGHIAINIKSTPMPELPDPLSHIFGKPNQAKDRDQPAIDAWHDEQCEADMLQMTADHADEQRRGESLVAAFGAVERAMKPDGVKW